MADMLAFTYISSMFSLAQTSVEVSPSYVATWLALILSGIALWSTLKKKARRDADLDGVGGRVNELESKVNRIDGEQSAMLKLVGDFVSSQQMIAQQVGEQRQAQAEITQEAREMRQTILSKLDKMQGTQEQMSNRLTRVETLMSHPHRS